MERYIIIFISLIISTVVNAECDFKSADYLTELDNPSSIKEIKINVNNSQKYYKNVLKILTSQTKEIPNKFKKQYNSKIIVNYNFGNCIFEGSVRQHGDHKDHIININGKIYSSLQVKLLNGNLMNSVRFKLLLPETRGNLNEILGTVIYRDLGFIAPETFQVNSNINGLKSVMLFQENIRKEMLERNLRTEGPLFEGDESLLFVDGERKHVDDIALSRQINKKWFLKGNNYSKISLQSFDKLQSAYLTRGDNIDLFDKFIQPNSNIPEIFQHFHYTSLALNAEHGLIPHNRNFYYNFFLDDFEPVYYDGDINFKKFDHLNLFKEDIFKLSFNREYKFPYLQKINSKEFENQLYFEFAKRTIQNKNQDKEFLKKGLEIFKENIFTLENIVKNYYNYIDYKKYLSKTFDSYIDRATKKNIDQDYITEINFNDNKFAIKYLSGIKQDITYENISNLISEMTLFGRRTILTKNNKTFNQTLSLENKNFLNGSFVKSSGINIVIDNKNKKLEIFQETANDWILFKNISFQNWNIQFNGKKNILKETNKNNRINEFGMTGCLSFYNSYFDSTTIYSKNASCEDSVNIVSSKGNINKIIIEDSYKDALDLDFSVITVESATISKALNDCIDLSRGNYFFKNVNLQVCGDKGVSIGEKSKFKSLDMFVRDSKIAVASKDLSIANIKNAKFTNTKVCYQAFQKKQEFGGSILRFKNISCSAKSIIDANSKLENISNEF